MKQLSLFCLFVGVACSTSAAPSSTSAGSAESGSDDTQPIDCEPITQGAVELDPSNTCYRSVAELDGICRQAVSATRTQGLEDVCAAKSGVLYRVTVATDEFLSGDGWTFGSRAAPNVVNQASTLSADDEVRCAQAPSVSASTMCQADAG